MCVALWRVKYASGLPRPEWAEVFDARGMLAFVTKCFLRTQCVHSFCNVVLYVGRRGHERYRFGRQRAARELLDHFFVLHGRLCLRRRGARGGCVVTRQPRFLQVLLCWWQLAVVFTLFLFAGGRGFLSMLTDDNATVSAAMRLPSLGTACRWCRCRPISAQRSVHGRSSFRG